MSAKTDLSSGNGALDQLPKERLHAEDPDNWEQRGREVVHADAPRGRLKRTTISRPIFSTRSASTSWADQKMKSLYVNEKYVRLQIVGLAVGHRRPGALQDDHLQLLSRRPRDHRRLRYQRQGLLRGREKLDERNQKVG